MTIAFNLSFPNYYQTSRAFLDIVKMAGWWVYDDYSGYEYDDPIFDANGYPTEVPVDEVIRLVFGNTTIPAGDYVFTYSGTGTFEFDSTSSITVTSTSAGRVEFTKSGEGSAWLDIEATDPGETGDYLRGFKLFNAANETAINAGDIFNPKWLKLVGKARLIRFMDWGLTNNSEMSSWADRPIQGNIAYVRLGISLEDMIALCNLLNADLYYCFPPRADDTFISSAATLIRDNLETGLKFWSAYSNENWNFAFQHPHWQHMHETIIWGNPAANWREFAAIRATQAAVITDTVFTSVRSRLVNVLETQASSASVTNALLAAQKWADTEGDAISGPPAWVDATLYTEGRSAVTESGTIYICNTTHTSVAPFELDSAYWDEFTGADWLTDDAGTLRVPTYVDPTTVFDRIGTTTYFGSAVVGDEDKRTEFLAAANNSSIDINAWIHEKLIDASYNSSVPDTQTDLVTQKAAALAAGLDGICGYEGGQHVHHSFAVSGLSTADIALIKNVMGAFVQSTEMADLYVRSWNSWKSVEPDIPYMQFTDCSVPGDSGSWGLLPALDTIPPRARAMFALNLGMQDPPTNGDVVVRCSNAA